MFMVQLQFAVIVVAEGIVGDAAYQGFFLVLLSLAIG